MEILKLFDFVELVYGIEIMVFFIFFLQNESQCAMWHNPGALDGGP